MPSHQAGIHPFITCSGCGETLTSGLNFHPRNFATQFMTPVALKEDSGRAFKTPFPQLYCTSGFVVLLLFACIFGFG